MEDNKYICYMGMVELDAVHRTFGLFAQDRRRHTYILGKSGMGKSTLMENMIMQDIYAGKGVCFIDPLGDSAMSIIDRIPPYRQKDVIYLNPGDRDYAMGLNLLEKKEGDSPSLIVAEIMSVMERIWAGAWSARMEYILSNALMALIDIGEQSLLGTLKMFGDKAFIDKVAKVTENIIVRNFWNIEYKQFPEGYRTEATAAIQNKIGQLFANPMIRNILGQVHSTVDFADIMDNNKILIANLAKGQIGENNCNLLGSLLVTKLQLQAMTRVNIPEADRKDFFLYIDEFQNFVNDSFVTILSEARKYRLNLTVAHQFLGQISSPDSEKIKQAIFGNVGTILCFQLGQEDAEYMSKEMQLENIPYFQNLEIGQMLIKPSIENKQTSTFFATTLMPMYTEFAGNYQKVTQMSRDQWCRPADEIEQEIKDYYKKEPSDNAKTRRQARRAAEKNGKASALLYLEQHPEIVPPEPPVKEAVEDEPKKSYGNGNGGGNWSNNRNNNGDSGGKKDFKKKGNYNKNGNNGGGGNRG